MGRRMQTKAERAAWCKMALAARELRQAQRRAKRAARAKQRRAARILLKRSLDEIAVGGDRNRDVGGD